MSTIHETKVRIDLKGLREEVKSLEQRYLEIGNRDTHEGRSRFSAWNNINHFLQRVDNGQDTVIVPVVGSVKGASARIYYQPSVTSLAKPIRKYIIPLKDGNKFMYFDLKAAEFFMNCVFCDMREAISAYQQGRDIYMEFAHFFPEGTERKVIKECLIANMYGVTPYTISKRCGVSESQADRLLAGLQRSLQKMEFTKISRIGYCRRNKGYFAPKGFDQTNLQKVAEIEPKEGFKPNLALSAYVQSALGMWMQNMIHTIEPLTRGTLLSVFDSMTIEFSPENEERLKSWLQVHISPFRSDSYSVGSTFYEAQYGKS